MARSLRIGSPAERRCKPCAKLHVPCPEAMRQGGCEGRLDQVIMGSMKPQSDPRVDYAFKHVFGREQNKPVLISLLEAVLQPGAAQRIASLDLLNPFNDK